MCYSNDAIEDAGHERRRAPARMGAPGFTLIELLVVLAIIGTLATLVAPQIFHHVGDAKSKTARAQIEAFALALDAYRLDSGEYPSEAQGLRALITAPSVAPIPANWRGPYMNRGIPKDPWGREYLYSLDPESNRERVQLLSLGRDGVIGGVGEDADVSLNDSLPKGKR